jgi:hypothetical protein
MKKFEAKKSSRSNRLLSTIWGIDKGEEDIANPESFFESIQLKYRYISLLDLNISPFL